MFRRNGNFILWKQIYENIFFYKLVRGVCYFSSYILCVVGENDANLNLFDQVSFEWTCELFESVCQGFTGTLSWMLRFPGVEWYRQTSAEAICMQQEYVRMKCLSKAFCIRLVSLCISALNHCALNCLLKMFVLLPTAAISRYKMTFIFLMCTYTHMLCADFDTICLLYPTTVWRVIMQWWTIALCSMKWNLEAEKHSGTHSSEGQHDSTAVICHH